MQFIIFLWYTKELDKLNSVTAHFGVQKLAFTNSISCLKSMLDCQEIIVVITKNKNEQMSNSSWKMQRNVQVHLEILTICCKYATTIEDFLLIYIALKLKNKYTTTKIHIYLPAIVKYVFCNETSGTFLLNVHYMQEVLKI